MNRKNYLRLYEGNQNYLRSSDAALRSRLATEGQKPYAIVICCADSRVIPEEIFSAGPGELFVIRVAGNVLDNHQLGSVEYAAGHLDCKEIIVLGHTGCGAVSAALSGGGEGFIKYITDDILEAIGEERDPDKAAELNVQHGVKRLRSEFSDHPEMDGVSISGALYNILTGEVRWTDIEKS